MPPLRFRTAVLVAALAALAPLASIVRADEPRPRGPLRYTFATYGTDQGLDSLSTMDLLEDAAGNLWIATQEGVVRFDGDRFESLGREDGLPSPLVFDLEQDRDGTLWAATLRGLARLDHGRFEATELPGSPAGESVEALALDGEGRLLAGAIGGVYRCEAALCARLFQLPTDQFVSAIALDRTHGELWFAGPFGLVRWKEKELERYGLEQGLPSLATRALLADRFGNLWIRQVGHLVRLDTADGSIEVQPPLPPAADTAQLLEDRQGTLWVTSDRGLHWLDHGVWRTIGSANGLPGAGVAALLEDHEGSLWIGTQYAGLARWLGRNRFHAWTEATGLPNDVVWAIARGTGGRLAIGTQGGLALVAPGGETLEVVDRARGLPGTYVLSLAADDAGGFWVGLVEGALAYVDRAGGVVDIGSRQEFPDDTSVTAIELGPGREVWLGTNNGLWQGRGTPQEIVFRRVTLPGSPNADGSLPPAEIFFDLLRDRQGVLWAGGRYGLARLADGRWSRLTRKDGLRDDFVLSLAEASDGALWIGYRDARGASELRWREGPQLRHFGRAEGLRHDQVTFVRADALGRIWIGTTHGLSVRVGDRFANFGRFDGMLSEDTCSNAFHADADGTAWIGTPRGALAARLSSDDLEPRAAPAARILSIALGGERYEPPTAPRVDHTHRAVDVAFSARTFRATQELEFRYSLVGLGEPPAVTTQHAVRYAALPPDRYTFEVAARLAGGGWGPPARMSFQILPPWWRTTPAGFAAVLLAAVAGLGLDRLRSRRERRRRAVLEEAVAERTRELDASRAELARTNDELAQLALTDPLTGLRNRRFAWEFFATEVTRIDREWERAAPGETADASIVFFLVDLDLFKAINDLHGHEIGDQILIEAAERVRHATRISDVAVRWGGEEFLVVARDLPPEERPRFAARLRQTIADPPYQPRAGMRTIACTSSLGYAAYPFDRAGGLSWQEVLRLADHALLAVKQTGRDADLGVTAGRSWNGAVPNDLLTAQAGGVVDLVWGRRKRS